jgi:hypothetical protein
VFFGKRNDWPLEGRKPYPPASSIYTCEYEKRNGSNFKNLRENLGHEDTTERARTLAKKSLKMTRTGLPGGMRKASPTRFPNVASKIQEIRPVR